MVDRGKFFSQKTTQSINISSTIFFFFFFLQFIYIHYTNYGLQLLILILVSHCWLRSFYYKVKMMANLFILFFSKITKNDNSTTNS